MNETSTLTAEELQEAQTPAWAREPIPAGMAPYVARAGLGEPWHSKKGPLGTKVLGIDRWQANHFIVYRPETAAFLDGPYTPLTVHYKPGLLPLHERTAAEYAGHLKTAVGKATVFVTRTLPERIPHATVPPIGAGCRTDRALDDEPLLASGCGFCNEQARVFIRLCQVSGIPARLVFLFYADHATGHTTAEFWTGSKWAMVDVSWYAVFPGPDGALMSAAECHGNAVQRGLMAETYYNRMQRILALSDEAIGGLSVPAGTPDRAAAVRAKAAELREYVRGFAKKDYLAGHLDQFGLLNVPLPS